MPELEPIKQLLLLRETTKTFGVLHEAQALQLRLWPHAVDPKLITAKAEISIDSNIIYWEWESKSKRISKHRLEALDRSVKLMLGDEWVIKIRLNQKPIWG